jgi:transcriptional regulator with XRE-family HTH domain
VAPPADDDPRPRSGSFGPWLANRRRELGLTQQDLADRLCAASGRATVTRHDLSRYERGIRLPSSHTLTLLAVCLDLPLPVVQRASAERLRH